MVTRFKLGAVKPNPKYALTSISSHSVPREPQNVQSALAHPGWKTAMEEEFTAPQLNQTWTLVPRTLDLHVICSKTET